MPPGIRNPTKRFGALVGRQEKVSQIFLQASSVNHRTRTFKEEYIELLKQAGVEFDERYLW